MPAGRAQAVGTRHPIAAADAANVDLRAAASHTIATRARKPVASADKAGIVVDSRIDNAIAAGACRVISSADLARIIVAKRALHGDCQPVQVAEAYRPDVSALERQRQNRTIR